jgi:opacity protein-like surface antigen
MEYYHENELTNIYTMLYKTHYRISADITFPISKHLTVNVLYRYLQKESPSYHIANNGQKEKESEETKSNNIIGGIKWTF